jgi:polar amino acid transport system substrate-binding protein
MLLAISKPVIGGGRPLRVKLVRFLLLLLGLVCQGAQLKAEQVLLTSLDWPPYSGATLTQQGASTAVVRAAFKAVGLDLGVHYYPWSRSVFYVRSTDSMYLGYFPEYYAEALTKDFLFSDPIGRGPLGFAQRKRQQITWRTLDDLRHFRIGVVRGYINTQRFDQMAADGQLTVQEVGKDKSNLLMLVNGRIDLAVIDRYVMNYLFEHDADLAKAKSLISFNDRLLDDRQLYVCFRNDEQGSLLRDKFNAGLRQVDIEAVMQDYLQQAAPSVKDSQRECAPAVDCELP